MWGWGDGVHCVGVGGWVWVMWVGVYVYECVSMGVCMGVYV